MCLRDRTIWRAVISGGAEVLTTINWYGAHHFQHHKADDEIRSLVDELQPDRTNVLNMDRYFERPQPIGIALRLVN